MYIKINLLPRNLRPKKTLIKLDVKTILIMLVVCGAIALGWYYYSVLSSFNKQTKQLDTLAKRENIIKDVVILQDDVEKLKKDVARRIEIIKELSSDSDLRFSVLDHINKVLPENLWLRNITETTDAGVISYKIEGMSYSKSNISKFVAGLEEFKKFKNVALESIAPAPLEVRDAYNYAVKVEVVSTQPVLEETGKGKKAGAAGKAKPKAKK